MPEPPQTPADIVAALRRDLAHILDRLPPNAESALHYEPFEEGEAQ